MQRMDPRRSLVESRIYFHCFQHGRLVPAMHFFSLRLMHRVKDMDENADESSLNPNLGF
jgi:hypothetical protein